MDDVWLSDLQCLLVIGKLFILAGQRPEEYVDQYHLQHRKKCSDGIERVFLFCCEVKIWFHTVGRFEGSTSKIELVCYSF